MFVKPGVVPLSRTLKLLTGLGQNGKWPGAGAQRSSAADGAPPAQRHDLTRSVISAERGKPVVSPPGKASREASRRGCGYRRREQAKAGL